MSPGDGCDLLNVLIVGCGNIAGGFDERGGSGIFTHAGAYRAHGGFRLAGCVEPNAERRAAFRAHWGVDSGFATINEALASSDRYDVISVCSPTACHEADLHAALRARPALVFSEKPVTSDLSAGRALIAAYRAAGVLLAVNHTRRWDQQVAAFRDQLQAGAWGTVRSVVGYYNKGILNNGSHMADLLHYLFGPLAVRAVAEPVLDFFTEDPTVPALLATQDGIPVHLAIGNAEDYALFELQVVTQRGTVAIEHGGFAWRERTARPSQQFAGYHVIDVETRHAGGSDATMPRAVANIHEAVRRGAPLASDGETALEAQALCEEIRQRALPTRN
jgi:predicted dehydrogenase